MLGQRPVYFGCNQCGHCCRDFLIPLSHQDILRLLDAWAGQTPETLFLLRPAEPSDVEALLFGGEWVHLLLQRRHDACVFLGEDGRCGSYESRPRACRTFPFDLGRFGQVRILPDAEDIYRQRCDRGPAQRVAAPVLRQARQQHRLGCDEFAQYRELVDRWNRWAVKQPPERQQLSAFIEMLRAWQELPG